MNGSCYFCGEPLDIERRPIDRHHRIPRRYFRRKQDADAGNIVPSHTSCHRRFHREVDNPKEPHREFLTRMRPLNFGHLIFASGGD